MPTASGQAGPAQRELAAINVGLMPDRPGMLLRQALQDRFEGTGNVVTRRYDLADNTITRTRLIGRANWTLTAQDLAHTRITSGAAHATDAENNLDTQIFASDLENEVIQKRLAEALADQIALQLAAFFRKRASVVAAS
jgi:LPS-assembly lipoprotein